MRDWSSSRTWSSWRLRVPQSRGKAAPERFSSISASSGLLGRQRSWKGGRLTQARAVSTFLPILCLIVVGRKFDRPTFEQSAHLLARSRRVHAFISREVAVHEWADEGCSGKRFEQPPHNVGPGLAHPC